jgi:hypothetical protein
VIVRAGTKIAEVDLERARSMGWDGLNDLLGDRREDLYGP